MISLLAFSIINDIISNENTMVGVAQMVEHRVVAPVVAGSSPVTHPVKAVPLVIAGSAVTSNPLWAFTRMDCRAP